MALYKPVLGVGWFYNNMYPSYFGVNVSASLYGVGYIVGPNVGGVIFLGSVLQWMITLPISAAVNNRWAENDWNTTAQGPFEPLNVARAEFKEARYIGVGLMFTGAMWALFSLRRALYTSIMFGINQFRALTKGQQHQTTHRYDRDVPFHYVLVGIAICIVGLYFVFSAFNDEWGYNVILACITVIPAFLFSAVAAYMAGLVGSSNNPISGVTLCSSLIISLVILGLFGTQHPLGPPTAIVMSCSVACACAISGDTIQDLKAGHVLGATPWKQEIILVLGVLATSFVVAPILELLNDAYTLGVPTGLGAPQASIMAAIPTGIITGNLPWTYIGIGSGLAVVIICLDQILLRVGAKFRLPVLGFAISFYLPIDVMVPIFIGGLVHVFAGTSADDQASEGVLFSAGLVSGESITGILCAVAVAIKGSEDVMHVIDDPSAWPAVFPLVAFLGSLFYVAKYQPFTRRGALLGDKSKRNYSVFLDQLEQR